MSYFKNVSTESGLCMGDIKNMFGNHWMIQRMGLQTVVYVDDVYVVLKKCRVQMNDAEKTLVITTPTDGLLLLKGTH